MFFGFFCFYFLFIDNFLKEFSKKYWVTALVRSMTFIWGFKPVFRYSKPHTYSTFIGEKEKQLCIKTMYLVHHSSFSYIEGFENRKLLQKVRLHIYIVTYTCIYILILKVGREVSCTCILFFFSEGLTYGWIGLDNIDTTLLWFCDVRIS